MNLGKVEIWETSLDRIVTLREGAKGVLRLRQEKGRIDLAAVFHADIPGEHQVQFRPTAQSSANPPGPVTIRFVWDPKRSTTVNTVGLRPGFTNARSSRKAVNGRGTRPLGFW